MAQRLKPRRWRTSSPCHAMNAPGDNPLVTHCVTGGTTQITNDDSCQQRRVTAGPDEIKFTANVATRQFCAIRHRLVPGPKNRSAFSGISSRSPGVSITRFSSNLSPWKTALRFSRCPTGFKPELPDSISPPVCPRPHKQSPKGQEQADRFRYVLCL